MERRMEYTVTVPCPVKEILQKHFHMSSTLISHLKQSGGILLNGTHVYVTAQANPGDVLEIVIIEQGSGDIQPENIPLEILYDDRDLTVINKPPYMPTHPSVYTRSGTVANAIMCLWGRDYVFRAVSRLDKNTSGLMVAVKNPYAHQRMCDALHSGKYRRVYCAVLDGILPQDEGVVNAPIARCSDSIIKRCVSHDGKRAVTHYKVLGRKNNLTLVELELETGRTHQIRVHMAYLGYPVTGDFLYGRENHAVIGRQALHCSQIEMIHPVSGKNISFCCPMPDDMANLIK